MVPASTKDNEVSDKTQRLNPSQRFVWNLQAYNMLPVAQLIPQVIWHIMSRNQIPQRGRDEQIKKKDLERKTEIWWETARRKSWHSSVHSHETDKSEKPEDSHFSSPRLHLRDADESAFCFSNVPLLC